MNAFEEWCHLLKKVQDEIIMYLDHKSFQYFMIINVLNQHQVQWAL